MKFLRHQILCCILWKMNLKQKFIIWSFMYILLVNQDASFWHLMGLILIDARYLWDLALFYNCMVNQPPWAVVKFPFIFKFRLNLNTKNVSCDGSNKYNTGQTKLQDHGMALYAPRRTPLVLKLVKSKSITLIPNQ